MLIPVLIFVVAFVAAVAASSRWLPDLAAGSVGGLAFFVVCGLLGAAAGLLGVQTYNLVEETNLGGESLLHGGELIGLGLQGMAFEVGSLLALTSIVYLLAPEPGHELEAEPETTSVS
jgi:hypothetical protein